MYSSFSNTPSQLDWTRLDYLNTYPFIQQLYAKPLEKYDGDVNITILAAQLDLETLGKPKRRAPKQVKKKDSKKTLPKSTPSIPINYLSLDDVTETELELQRDLIKKERKKKEIEHKNILLEIDTHPVIPPTDISFKEPPPNIEPPCIKKRELLRAGCDLQVKMNQSRLLHHCLRKWRYKIHAHSNALHQCQLYRQFKIKQATWKKWIQLIRAWKSQREDLTFQTQLSQEQTKWHRAERFFSRKRLTQCFCAWKVYQETSRYEKELHTRARHLQSKQSASLLPCPPPAPTPAHPPVTSRPPPLFLQRMEARAKERQQRKEARLQQQHEKTVKEAEAREEAERKRMERLALEKQAQRQREKEAEEAKRQWQQQFKRLQQQACEHHVHWIRVHVLRKWGRVLRKKQACMQQGLAVYSRFLWKRLRKTYLCVISVHAQVVLNQRHSLLKRQCVKSWRKYKAAIEFETLRNRKRIKIWRIKAQISFKLHAEKMERDSKKADAFALIVIQRWYFNEWRTYVQWVKDERWRDYRKSLLRNKVRELLVDSTLERLCHSTSIESCFVPNEELAFKTETGFQRQEE